MRYYKVINNLSENEDSWDLGEVLNYDEYDIGNIDQKNWDDTFIISPLEINVDTEDGIKETDYYLSTTGIQIVSEKFKTLLTPEEASFYPVTFLNFKAGQKYYALRINDFYDCVDESKSEFEYWNQADVEEVPIRVNTYRGLNRFYINESKVGSSRIFRLLKYSPVIVVDEKLKVEIEKANIMGLGFATTY